MQRILAWLAVFVLCGVCSFAFLLFTSIGNAILIPFAQGALNYSLPFSTTIHSLRIGFGQAQAQVSVNKALYIRLSGAYSLKGLDMQASVYPLDSIPQDKLDSHTLESHSIESSKLADLRLLGSYSDYSIISVQAPNMQLPLTPRDTSSLTLLAHMRFFTMRDYRLRLDSVPAHIIAQFLSLHIEPKGRISLLMQAESSTTQLRIQSDGFSLGDMPCGIELAYMRSYTSKEPMKERIAATLILPKGKLVLQSTPSIDSKRVGVDSTNERANMQTSSTQASDTLQSVIYVRETQVATLILTRTPQGLSYGLSITDLARFSEVFGLALRGDIVLRGDIGYDDGLRVRASSESLGGLSIARLEQGTLSMSGERVTLARMLELWNAPQALSGTINFKVLYNPTFHKGNIQAVGENLRILLDDLERYGLNTFSTYNSAQDSWGVGFESTESNANLTLNGTLDGAKLSAQLTLEAQDTSIHSSKCIIDFGTQKLDMELLALSPTIPSLRIQGAFNALRTSIAESADFSGADSGGTEFDEIQVPEVESGATTQSTPATDSLLESIDSTQSTNPPSPQASQQTPQQNHEKPTPQDIYEPPTNTTTLPQTSDEVEIIQGVPPSNLSSP